MYYFDRSIQNYILYIIILYINTIIMTNTDSVSGILISKYYIFFQQYVVSQCQINTGYKILSLLYMNFE